MIFEAIILGIVQGITEFLPISSSAHLIILPWMFRWQGTLIDSLNFDVALHAGTLVAILAFFWRDWLDLFRKFFTGIKDGTWKSNEGRLVWFIALATIPAGVLGLKYEHVVEETFRNPILISAALVAVSGVMWAADRYSAKAISLGRMSLGHSLFIGFAQALALVPGVSRSGITISAGLLSGYKREECGAVLLSPVHAGHCRSGCSETSQASPRCRRSAALRTRDAVLGDRRVSVHKTPAPVSEPAFTESLCMVQAWHWPR